MDVLDGSLGDALDVLRAIVGVLLFEDAESRDACE